MGVGELGKVDSKKHPEIQVAVRIETNPIFTSGRTFFSTTQVYHPAGFCTGPLPQISEKTKENECSPMISRSFHFDLQGNTYVTPKRSP